MDDMREEVDTFLFAVSLIQNKIQNYFKIKSSVLGSELVTFKVKNIFLNKFFTVVELRKGQGR